MVVWRNAIKHTLRALLPIAILPGLLLGSMILSFGLTIETVVITVMLAEVYLVWIQVEVSMRQIKISELVYEPILLAEMRMITNLLTNTAMLEIKLKNTGEYPAYSVFTNILDPRFLPVEEMGKMVGTIGPKGEETIYTLDEVTFRKYPEFSVEVNYYNSLGRSNELTFVFHRQYIPHSLAIPGRTVMPGILLNSIEELRMISGLLTMKRRIKRLRKDQSKLAV